MTVVNIDLNAFFCTFFASFFLPNVVKEGILPATGAERRGRNQIFFFIPLSILF